MCRRLTSLAALAVALVLGGLIAPAFGADGSGAVYIPNSIDDPALHPVVLSDLDGSGFLRGPAADVTNALIPRAQSNTLDFNYSPATPGASRIHFAETMAYYHMSTYDRYVESLGFGAATYPIPATVFNGISLGYGLYSPIQTGYAPNTRSISLALTVDGKQSDALDGDVIVHEYAHAVQHRLRGGALGMFVSAQTSGSEQALALMEGQADFAAVSRFGNPRLGEWSATIWQGRAFLRNIDNFNRWPADFAENNVYQTAMIFSGALWDLRSAVGREVADRLAWQLVQAVPDNNPSTPELNTTFADALATLLQADTGLYGGGHQNTIRQAFAVHGIGTFDFSTPFPMVRDPGNNYDGFSVYSVAGAPALAITFDQFVTKLDDLPYLTDELPRPVADAKATSDWLTILNASDNVIGNFTGRQLQGATIIVPGDTAKFHLTTDGARASFGYRVVDITTDLSNRELVLAAGEGVVEPLEAASKDLGTIPDAWRESAAIGTLTVGTAARVGRVRLVDAFANHPGGKPEALYVHNLTIAEGSKLDLAGLHLYIDGTFANAGTLDVSASSLVIDYGESGASPLAQIVAWIKSGQDQEGGGLWDGPGIISSIAAADPITYGVAVADNAHPDMLMPFGDGITGPLFGNVTPVPVNPQSILVKLTYNGDVNLDGCVDDNDVTFMNLFYDGGAVGGKAWFQGDVFLNDGLCDDNDVTILNLTYGLGVGSPLGPVPEPSAIILLGLGAMAVARRRRLAA